MKIKIQISILLFVFLYSLFINNRYPFYQNINDAWSIGYNIGNEIGEVLDIDNDNNIIMAKDLEPIKDQSFW